MVSNEATSLIMYMYIEILIPLMQLFLSLASSFKKESSQMNIVSVSIQEKHIVMSFTDLMLLKKSNGCSG